MFGILCNFKEKKKIIFALLSFYYYYYYSEFASFTSSFKVQDL